MSRYGDLIKLGHTPHQALAVIYDESMARKQEYVIKTRKAQ